MAGPPIWAVGQVLTASDVNQWLIPAMVVKTVDTGRASNTTPAADPDLSIAVTANARYVFNMLAVYTGGTNGSSDAQFGLSAPSGATFFGYALRNQISGLTLSNFLLTASSGAINAGTNGTTNFIGFWVQGQLAVSSTAGQFALIWSQNSSNGTATTVKAGSYLTLQRIS